MQALTISPPSREAGRIANRARLDRDAEFAASEPEPLEIRPPERFKPGTRRVPTTTLTTKRWAAR